jgi:hypothetical protein
VLFGCWLLAVPSLFAGCWKLLPNPIAIQCSAPAVGCRLPPDSLTRNHTLALTSRPLPLSSHPPSHLLPSYPSFCVLPFILHLAPLPTSPLTLSLSLNFHNPLPPLSLRQFSLIPYLDIRIKFKSLISPLSHNGGCSVKCVS